jgi:hypothetical protein
LGNASWIFIRQIPFPFEQDCKGKNLFYSDKRENYFFFLILGNNQLSRRLGLQSCGAFTNSQKPWQKKIPATGQML